MTAIAERTLQLVSSPFVWLGSIVLNMVTEIGAFVIYIRQTFHWMFRRPFRLSLLMQQMEFIGNQSLMIVIISALSVGAVFALQIGGIFQLFGAQSLTGAATGKALCQELAPLVTAILLTGRAGSSMTAEISTMKVNEQVDAMEAMAVDPISYLVVPRVLAGTLMGPLLCGVFILIGVIGAYVVGVTLFDVDRGLFTSKITQFVMPSDIWRGLVKSFVFSFIMTTLACRYGLNASGGAKGVGRATTNSVVTTLLTILGVDVVITYFQVVW